MQNKEFLNTMNVKNLKSTHLPSLALALVITLATVGTGRAEIIDGTVTGTVNSLNLHNLSAPSGLTVANGDTAVISFSYDLAKLFAQTQHNYTAGAGQTELDTFGLASTYAGAITFAVTINGSTWTMPSLDRGDVNATNSASGTHGYGSFNEQLYNTSGSKYLNFYFQTTGVDNGDIADPLTPLGIFSHSGNMSISYQDTGVTAMTFNVLNQPLAYSESVDGVYVTPEPSTWVISATGLIGLIALSRRRSLVRRS